VRIAPEQLLTHLSFESHLALASIQPKNDSPTTPPLHPESSPIQHLFQLSFWIDKDPCVLAITAYLDILADTFFLVCPQHCLLTPAEPTVPPFNSAFALSSNQIF
jgi:hypothetical protein